MTEQIAQMAVLYSPSITLTTAAINPKIMPIEVSNFMTYFQYFVALKIVTSPPALRMMEAVFRISPAFFQPRQEERTSEVLSATRMYSASGPSSGFSGETGGKGCSMRVLGFIRGFQKKSTSVCFSLTFRARRVLESSASADLRKAFSSSRGTVSPDWIRALISRAACC